MIQKTLPDAASGKEYACQCKTCGFNPWVGKSPGVGNGNPLQYSCLGNFWTEEYGRLHIPWVAQS